MGIYGYLRLKDRKDLHSGQVFLEEVPVSTFSSTMVGCLVNSSQSHILGETTREQVRNIRYSEQCLSRLLFLSSLRPSTKTALKARPLLVTRLVT